MIERAAVVQPRAGMLEELERGQLVAQEALRERIRELKRRRNALIIAHNYQHDEVQDIADLTGDSLGLSQAAVRVEADVIVFCGVDFMAESAAILNPDKMVLLPELRADCPMAKMASVERLRHLKAQHPGAAVVCYVNSSAEVKAESDVCCTSANAIDVVRAIPQRRVIMVPDRNLGHWVQRHLPKKEIVLWKGFCPTHMRLTVDDVVQAKSLHPSAEFVAHPECQPDVLDLADHVCSTGGMLTYVRASASSEFIIGTESGMLYRLRQDSPGKRFYLPTTRLTCPTMKMTTLEKVVWSVETAQHVVTVSEDLRQRAQRALQRMLEVTREHPWVALAGY